MSTTTRWTLGGVLAAVFVVVAMWGLPQYKIYRLELRGQAELKEAEWSKQILIEEAKAQMESASMYAQAEVERAKGVAEANKIIGESLKDNEGYLRYRWIQGLHNETAEVIYVPTEAGLPILEAGRNMQRPHTVSNTYSP